MTKQHLSAWILFCVLGCGQGWEDSEPMPEADGPIPDPVEAEAFAELSEPLSTDGELTEAATLRRRLCFSSSHCPPGAHCSSAEGICETACAPGVRCRPLCLGVCRAAPAPPNCGTATCGAGTYCCNPSCNACVPRGSFCTQQVCLPEQ